MSLDASRPWLIYWIIHSFAILDAELDPRGRQRAVSTLAHCRPSPDSPRGGFGGGPGQRPHLATTYAAVLALAYVGDERAWSDRKVIDRRAMHDWLVSLKQPDGSFVMHEGGEVDIRGSYCALTVATMLNILTPDLTEGCDAFAARCARPVRRFVSASDSARTVARRTKVASPPHLTRTAPADRDRRSARPTAATLFALSPLISSSDPSRPLRHQEVSLPSTSRFCIAGPL